MYNYQERETIAITSQTSNLPLGTKGLYGGTVIASGFQMIAFVILDADFYAYLEKHNFKNIDHYIEYQKKHSHFGDTYWKNPFDVVNVYPEHVMSLNQLQEREKLYLEEKEKAETMLNRMSEYKKFFE